MMGNLGNLMKQAMEAQKKAEQLKEELANVRIDAEAAGGLVKVVVNGVSELLEITIDGAKLGLEPDDVELLQDAIMAAMHDGARQAQDTSSAMMQKLTAGLKLPPGFSL